MDSMDRKGVERKFSDVCEEWLCMERLVVKQSTYARYEHTVRKHIVPVIGERNISDINSSAVNYFVYEKLHHGRLTDAGPLSVKTVRDICVILKSIIGYAEMEYGFSHIADNAVLPKKRKQEPDILSGEEQQLLERYLWEHAGEPRCAGLLICLYTGLRLGEICALQWQDVNLQAQVLQVRHTIQRIPVSGEMCRKTLVILDEPKSEASFRTIPLTDNLRRLFEQLSPNKVSTDYILTDSARCIEPRNYQYYFRRVLELLDMRIVNFHILRHTFASRCVECGFDIKTLSEILGHSSTSITLSYYVHTTLEMKRKQMELLA